MARKNATQKRIEKLIADLNEDLEQEKVTFNSSRERIRQIETRIADYQMLIDDAAGEKENE